MNDFVIKEISFSLINFLIHLKILILVIHLKNNKNKLKVFHLFATKITSLKITC